MIEDEMILIKEEEMKTDAIFDKSHRGDCEDAHFKERYRCGSRYDQKRL